jgi:hypothetical protein
VVVRPAPLTVAALIGTRKSHGLWPATVEGYAGVPFLEPDFRGRIRDRGRYRGREAMGDEKPAIPIAIPTAIPIPIPEAANNRPALRRFAGQTKATASNGG